MMVAHHARHGRILTAYESTVWVRTQRAEGAAGTMSDERRALLEALPFWKWKPEFEVYLDDLAKYHADHGSMPPKGSDGGKWLTKQQKHFSRGMSRSEANKKKVEAFGGPVATAIMALAGSAGLCPSPSVGPSAEPPRGPSADQVDRPPIRRFPRPTDDGDVRAREAWDWESKLLEAARFHREHGRRGGMPQHAWR